MLKSLELTKHDQKKIFEYCIKSQIQFLSSPFDNDSVDFLKELDIPIIKIPSGEITNFPLLLKIARTNKKTILSTGMSTLGEIEAALAVLAFGYTHLSEKTVFSQSESLNLYYSKAGQTILRDKVSLLHCSSDYPVAYEDVNLRAIQTLEQAFDLPTGYSDHTLGIVVAIGAVARGAKIIEKHFTIDKSLVGPDHQASIDPMELKSMITSIRQIELALGSSHKIQTIAELKNRSIVRKSLVASRAIKKGELFTENNLCCKRPGEGVSPVYFYDYKNKYAERDYAKDEMIGI